MIAGMIDKDSRRVRLDILVVLAVVLFGWFTAAQHIEARGESYLDTGNQAKRHQAILDGHAGSPWQYRVLTVYPIEAAIRGFEAAGAEKVRSAVEVWVVCQQDARFVYRVRLEAMASRRGRHRGDYLRLAMVAVAQPRQVRARRGSGEPD